MARLSHDEAFSLVFQALYDRHLMLLFTLMTDFGKFWNLNFFFQIMK